MGIAAQDRSTLFLFSGQGSQSFHMGKELFDQEPEFARIMRELDREFQAQLGHSILDSIYDSRARRSDPLDDILVSHPAIFMVEYALANLLMSWGITPDLVLGVSLGEIAAATIAEVLTLDEAIRMVAHQARVFASIPSDGGLIAVLHDVDDCREQGLLRDAELAAVNYGSNFVVAANASGLRRTLARLQELGFAYHRLPVRQAFHSSWIDPLRERLMEECAPAGAWPRPSVPFVSCATGGVVDELSADQFWRAVREPVQLCRAVEGLEQLTSYDYVDVGATATLTTIIRRIVGPPSRSRLYPVLDPFAPLGKTLERLRREVPVGPPRPLRPRRGGPAAPRSPWEERLHELRRVPVDEGLAVVFPGQGSQAHGMGRELFGRYPELVAIADRVLGYSLETLCLDDPRNELSQTQFTQPALYVVNALAYLDHLSSGGARPGFLAGHSLGEYDALLCAEVFDFEVGLGLVQQRGALMSRVSGGGMAAVIGIDAEQVAQILQDEGIVELDVANFNAPTQTVISGPSAAIDGAKPAFTKRGAHYIPLRVSAPFHSRYMGPVASELDRFARELAFRRPTRPVISNVTAEPYAPDAVRNNLAEQLRRPVRWTDTVRYLAAHGVERFVELGPGRVLTKLVATIRGPHAPTEPSGPRAR